MIGIRQPRILWLVLSSLLLCQPWIRALFWPAGGGLDVKGYQIGHDFINVWAGPQLAFDGRLATLFDLSAYHQAIGELFGQPIPFHNWGYPPFTLVAFWPLAQLPYFWALAVWTIGLFTAFAAVTLSKIDPEDRLKALIVLAAAPACLINAVCGQNGFLSAVLMLGGILSIDRRPILAGVLFGLLTFKPHLGLVLPFALLALGAWRVIFTASLTAAALVLISIAFFGIEPWRLYIGATSAYQTLLLERFEGFYTIMMASVVAAARMSGISFQAAITIQLAVALVVLVAACWAVRRTNDPCQRAFVLVSAVPLITPYVFNYDLTALAAVLTWKLFRPLPAGRLRICLMFAAWLLPILLMYFNWMRVGAAPFVLAGIFALSVYEAWGEHPQEISPKYSIPENQGAVSLMAAP
jgi:Glycosyltransferase family 87